MCLCYVCVCVLVCVCVCVCMCVFMVSLGPIWVTIVIEQFSSLCINLASPVGCVVVHVSL